MPTVIATVGASNANSYLTVVEGDTYHSTHLYASDWTGATTTVKETALIMATRLIDAWYEWAEWATTETQALRWPRTGILAANQLEYVAEDEIPTELKWATAEFARQLIAEDRTTDNEIDSMGIRSLSAGPVSLTFAGRTESRVLPEAVISLIPEWWGHPKNTGGFSDLLRG